MYKTVYSTKAYLKHFLRAVNLFGIFTPQQL